MVKTPYKTNVKQYQVYLQKLFPMFEESEKEVIEIEMEGKVPYKVKGILGNYSLTLKAFTYMKIS